MLRSAAVMMLGLVSCAPKAGPAGATVGIAETSSGGSSAEASETSGAVTTTEMEASSGTTTGEVVGSSSGGGTIGEGEACDFHAQDCAEGLKCVSSGALCYDKPFVCAPLVEMPLGEGERCRHFDQCGGLDECDAGLVCIPLDWEDQSGSCARICEGVIGVGFFCSGEGEVCHGIGGLTVVCVKTCSPLGNDCPAGMTCARIPGSESHVGCAALDPSAGGLKSPCAADVDCLPGLACAYNTQVPGCDSLSCCVNFCELGVPGGCDALPGTTCQPFADAPEVGWCVPPP